MISAAKTNTNSSLSRPLEFVPQEKNLTVKQVRISTHFWSFRSVNSPLILLKCLWVISPPCASSPFFLNICPRSNFILLHTQPVKASSRYTHSQEEVTLWSGRKNLSDRCLDKMRETFRCTSSPIINAWSRDMCCCNWACRRVPEYDDHNYRE